MIFYRSSMSKRVFEEELGRETVFRDAGKLLPDYVPPVLVHRDEEFRMLTQFFRPVIDSRASQRALVTGSTGVGKTSMTMKFGEEFRAVGKEKGISLDYLHINCRKEKTIHAVFMKLVHHY
ncbi:MAG: hypothetical protein AB1744_12310, partial [Candidatus Zixiibacteriota bacterium]